jgi:hypothetical protein
MELLAERLGESNERMTEITSKAVLPRLASQVLRQLESEGLWAAKGAKRCRAPTPTRAGAR